MSVDATKWAWEQQAVRGTQKLVLLSLADHAGEDHDCWPTVHRLAERCGVSSRAARAALTALADARLLHREVRSRDDKSQASNRYVLHVDPNLTYPEADDPPGGDDVPPPPEAEAQAPRNEASALGVNEASPHEPSVEPPVEPPEEETAPEEVLWEAILDKAPPAVRELTKSRRTLLTKALNEVGLDVCLAALDGLVEYVRRGKGELDWTRPFKIRPTSGPLADQLEWWASQGQSSSSVPAPNDLLRMAHPNARERLLREHHLPDDEDARAKAAEVHEALARRGFRAVFNEFGLTVARIES